MPLYPYQCSNCGRQDELFLSMSDYTPEQPCVCGARMQRVFTTDRVRNPNFHTPIAMFSVAPTNPQELADFRRKCPDIHMTPQLVPLAHNRTEKKQILKAVGFEEKS